jgi:hypothetical protein
MLKFKSFEELVEYLEDFEIPYTSFSPILFKKKAITNGYNKNIFIDDISQCPIEKS